MRCEKMQRHDAGGQRMTNNEDRAATIDCTDLAESLPAGSAATTGNTARATARNRAASTVRVRNSTIHGRGVFATRAIKKGERVIEQKGARITHDECDALDSNSTESGHTFLFTLNDDYVIDTNRGGNAARWINHGCTPNCESEYEEDDLGRPHKDRIFINAMRDIKIGEELTYDYFITLDEEHTDEMKKIWQCLCGARKCIGTMLAEKDVPVDV
jgi:uncharacterized protein